VRADRDSVRLEWSAEPGLGATGWSGYRVYRRAPGADTSFAPAGPALLEASAVALAEYRRGATYSLRAVNAFGAEQELGRVTLEAVPPGLRAWPVPSGEFDSVHLAMTPPLDAAGRTPDDFAVTVFDLNGRRVRRLAGGHVPVVVGEVRLEWDRLSEEGREAAAGVYFVRAEVPSAGWRIDRRVVIVR
jgi:hypothetical protein